MSPRVIKKALTLPLRSTGMPIDNWNMATQKMTSLFQKRVRHGEV